MVKLKKLHSYYQTMELRQFINTILSEKYSYFLFGEFFAIESDLIFILEENNETIGAIIGLRESDNIGIIAMLGIKNEYRKKGFAKLLVKIVLNSFIEKGFESVYVDTDESNFYALMLYKSIGFNVVEYYERYYSDCKGALRLKINLKKMFEIDKNIFIENCFNDLIN